MPSICGDGRQLLTDPQQAHSTIIVNISAGHLGIPGTPSSRGKGEGGGALPTIAGVDAAFSGRLLLGEERPVSGPQCPTLAPPTFSLIIQLALCCCISSTITERDTHTYEHTNT